MKIKRARYGWSLVAATVLIAVPVAGAAQGDSRTIDPQAIERLVNQFNASQDRVQVSLAFQGSYTDSLNKVLASLGSQDVPALVQLEDTATRRMVDSAIPVARATPVMPPRPAARASVAAHSRRARSVKTGTSVLYFARQTLTFTHAA